MRNAFNSSELHFDLLWFCAPSRGKASQLVPQYISIFPTEEKLKLKRSRRVSSRVYSAASSTATSFSDYPTSWHRDHFRRVQCPVSHLVHIRRGDMSGTFYDMDLTGGLMPQIQALIAPPSLGPTRRAKPSSFRPGTSGINAGPTGGGGGGGTRANRSYCDFCREGGDLLCCDRCPAAFHFQCHEPPLDEDAVPEGEWLCKRCTKIKTDQEEYKTRLKASATSASSKPDEASSILTDYVDIDATSRDSVLSQEVATDVDTMPSPMALLIQAATYLNPKEFSLSNEYEIPFQFPGSSKLPCPTGQSNNGNKTNRKPSDQYHHHPVMSENGHLIYSATANASTVNSLPFSRCILCDKSCRTVNNGSTNSTNSVLVQCDFCPGLYHMDCLDPPLTGLPTGRWMCPNHVEPILEQKLLNTNSLSQRVKLWSLLNEPINQDAIKMQFLRKVHRDNEPFRVKSLQTTTRIRARVPQAIKDHYARPIKSIATHADASNNSGYVYSMDLNVNRVIQEEDRLESLKHGVTGAEASDQDLWLSSLVKLQSSIVKHLSGLPSHSKTSSKSSSQDVHAKGVADPVDNDSLPVTLCNGDASYGNGIMETDCRLGEKSAEILSSDRPTKSSIARIEDFVKRIGNARTNATDSNSSNEFSSFKGTQELDESSLELLDEDLIKYLALQRLKQLVDKTSAVPCPLSSTISENYDYSGPDSQSSVFPSSHLNGLAARKSVKRICLPNVRARAIICPVSARPDGFSSHKPFVAMSYRTFTIGSSADNDLVLGDYSECNFISAIHASIIYDDLTNEFELINYSEHGTTVDNVLYSCDFSSKKRPAHAKAQDAQDSGAAKKVPVVNAISQIVAKRKRKANGESNVKSPSKKSAKGQTVAKETDEAAATTSKSAAGAKNGTPSRANNNGNRLNLKVQRSQQSNGSNDGAEHVPSLPMSTEPSSRMNGRMERPRDGCTCQASASSLMSPLGIGWEGSAQLRHNSFISMGCIQFVFSIPGHATSASLIAAQHVHKRN